MKAFFEEYGFAIVAAIVVIALIAIVNSDAFQSTFRTSMSSLNNPDFRKVFSDSMSDLVGSFTGFATDSIPVVG